MQQSIKNITVTMFPEQYEAFCFSTQFAAAVAGVQSGKTFLGAHWAGKKIHEFPKGNGIIVAPIYNILRQATLRKFFEIHPYYRRYYRDDKGEINLPRGGTIYLRSADNPLGIEGITAEWIWLDEGGMTSQFTWTVLRSRVSVTGGQILITTTPYNMGWLYKDFYLPAKEKRDLQLSFYTWPSIANPMFPKEYFEAEQKRLPPEEFARRYMGEFKKMAGLVWDLPDSQVIAPIEGLAQKADARIAGVDWGFKNPAAIVVLYRYDDAWYMVDEWKSVGQTTGEIIQVLQNKVAEHRITRVYPDPAEPDRIEECKQAGVPVYNANKDVLGGISHIRELIYQKRFFVYEACKETLAEMSMYHYAEPHPGDEDKEIKEEPEKFNDHLMDAMRYALYSYPHQPIKFGEASPLVTPWY